MDEETDDNKPPQPIFRPARHPGPQMVTGAHYSVLELFCVIIASIWRTVVSNTNKYGARHNLEK